MSDCIFCPDSAGVETCGAEKRGVVAFNCTRPVGHDGPHVACAPTNGLHELNEWSVDAPEAGA